MRRAIFSTVIALLICLVFQGTAFSAAAEVRGSADIRNSGEILGNVIFCGPQGSNGSVVDLVGRSFSAVLGAGIDFFCAAGFHCQDTGQDVLFCVAD